MYVKLTNGEIEQFPYTLGDFRRDNPNTSFPKVIPDYILRSSEVFLVREMELPTIDALTQVLAQNDIPHKEVIRNKTEEDATDPTTGVVDDSQVGQPIYGNQWLIGHTVQDKPLDEAESNIRNQRDILIAKTDYLALSDNVLSDEQSVYRQALRDVTSQAGFPYSVTWPTKPE